MTKESQTPISEIASEPNKLVPIPDLDTFIQLISAWHQKQVATIQHLSEVPPGTEVVVEGEAPFKMEGDILKGFQLGINMSMQYLGILPFEAEYEDATVPT